MQQCHRYQQLYYGDNALSSTCCCKSSPTDINISPPAINRYTSQHEQAESNYESTQPNQQSRYKSTQPNRCSQIWISIVNAAKSQKPNQRSNQRSRINGQINTTIDCSSRIQITEAESLPQNNRNTHHQGWIQISMIQIVSAESTSWYTSPQTNQHTSHCRRIQSSIQNKVVPLYLIP